MSETAAAPPPLPPQRSDLAKKSLMYGLISIPLAALTLPFGIFPTIIGCLALVRIHQSKGQLTGSIMAITGILLGVLTFLACLPHDSVAIDRAKRVKALACAMAIKKAIIDYHHDRGAYLIAPDNGVLTTDSAAGAKLLTLLLGDKLDPSVQSHCYLDIREGKNNKDGIIYDESRASVIGLFDPWGNPFTVHMNVRYKGRLNFTIGTETIDLPDTIVAVYSPGKDGKPGTKDDVKAW